MLSTAPPVDCFCTLATLRQQHGVLMLLAQTIKTVIYQKTVLRCNQIFCNGACLILLC